MDGMGRRRRGHSEVKMDLHVIVKCTVLLLVLIRTVEEDFPMVTTYAS